MRLFRNRKVKIVVLILLILGIAEGAFVYFLAYDLLGMASVFVTLFLILCVYLISELHQSRKINRFHSKLDRNLQGRRDMMDFEDVQEGDFESLEAAIGKMLSAHYAQQDALQSEKEVLQNTLAEISHQIKTPLAAISLTSDMIADPELDPLERSLRVERMQKNVERIGFFIKTLLQISRLDAGVECMRSDTFTVEDLIYQACEQLMELIEDREIDVQLDVPSEIEITGDKVWLMEAVSNIIKNCIEHSSTGDTIYISAIKNAVFTRIEIRDTGAGIADEDLPHIFDLYYKGKNSSSSSIGIGLYLARKVIHDHNGTVTAGNHPQGGALFTIRLNQTNV